MNGQIAIRSALSRLPADKAVQIQLDNPHLFNALRSTDYVQPTTARALKSFASHYSPKMANANFFEWHSARMMNERLERLKVSMDLQNMTAKGRADWDIFYREFETYYRPDKFGWTAGDADWDQLDRRERDLESWKTKLSSEGVKVAEPPRDPLPDSGGLTGSVTSVLDKVVMVGGITVVGLLAWRFIKPNTQIVSVK